MIPPIWIYLKGRDLKRPESELFPVSRSHAQDLRDNGLVVQVRCEPPTAVLVEPAPVAPAARDPVVSAPQAPPVDTAASRRRGRPPAKRI